MVLVYYQHRACINVLMRCTTPVCFQIQKNVTRTVDAVYVCKFGRRVYRLRWQ